MLVNPFFRFAALAIFSIGFCSISWADDLMCSYPVALPFSASQLLTPEGISEIYKILEANIGKTETVFGDGSLGYSSLVYNINSAAPRLQWLDDPFGKDTGGGHIKFYGAGGMNIGPYQSLGIRVFKSASPFSFGTGSEQFWFLFPKKTIAIIFNQAVTHVALCREQSAEDSGSQEDFIALGNELLNHKDGLADSDLDPSISNAEPENYEVHQNRISTLLEEIGNSLANDKLSRLATLGTASIIAIRAFLVRRAPLVAAYFPVVSLQKILPSCKGFDYQEMISFVQNKSTGETMMSDPLFAECLLEIKSLEKNIAKKKCELHPSVCI